MRSCVQMFLILPFWLGNESARILKESCMTRTMAMSLAPQNGATGGTSLIYFESQALMLCYGAVLLRGSDERSHEDFAAVSHS